MGWKPFTDFQIWNRLGHYKAKLIDNFMRWSPFEDLYDEAKFTIFCNEAHLNVYELNHISKFEMKFIVD